MNNVEAMSENNNAQLIKINEIILKYFRSSVVIKDTNDLKAILVD